MPLATTEKIDKNRLCAEYTGRDRLVLCAGETIAMASTPVNATRVELMARKPKRKSTARAKHKRTPRTKAEQRAKTLEHILDAAELLFSKHGLHGVTLRDVAQKVGVHTSLMHYYFEDKFALFTAVFVRRSPVTSERRMKALDQYEKNARGKPTVAGALHAFLDTDFDLYIGGGEGWKNYGAFGSHLSNTPEGAAMFDEHFDPVVLRLISILRKALPDVPPEEIFWGYHFVTGSFMHSLSRSGRLDRLSGGLCRSDDLKSVKARMADFMAAGFTALNKR